MAAERAEPGHDGSGSGPLHLQRPPLRVLLLGFAGAALTIFAGKGHLPGIGNDATSYWAIADHLEGGRGLGYFLEPKLTLWPPGWPVYLATLKWLTPLSVPVIALYTNALLVVVSTRLTWRLVTRFTTEPILIWAACVSAAVGPATLSQSFFLQTETSFLCLVLFSFVLLLRFGDTRRTLYLAAAVATMWLAFMDRYVGIVLIGAETLWLVLELGEPRWSARIRNAATFFAGSITVPAIWLVRNAATNDWRWGTVFGPRDTPIHGLKTNTVDAVTSLGQFVIGIWQYQPWRGALRALALVALVAAGSLALLLAKRWRDARTAPTVGSPARSIGLLDAAGHPLALLVIYVVAHFAYMIYSASTIAFDPVNTRYLSPIFIPAIIVGVTLIDRGCRGDDRVWSMARTGVIVWMVVQVGCGIGIATSPWWNRFAAGYNGSEALSIRDSAIFDRLPTDCTLRTNIPMALYPLGVESQIWPRETKFASSDVPPDLDELRGELSRGDVCLIWLKGFDSQVEYEYSRDAMRTMFPTMRVVDEDDNVTIYRIAGSVG